MAVGKPRGCWEAQLLIRVSLNPPNLACLLPGLCFHSLVADIQGVIWRLCVLIAVGQSQAPAKTRRLMFSEGFQMEDMRGKMHSNGGFCATGSCSPAVPQLV